MSAQPSADQAYQTEGNPASKEPAEQVESQANQRATENSTSTNKRTPHDKQTSSIDDATPTSLGRGVRGAGAGEDPSSLSAQDQGQTADVNAEQMGAPGEGRVTEAVEKKPGAGGKQPGLESDLDRKKAQQAPMREQVKEEKERDVDVGGVLGQRGGPASTVS